MMLTLILIIALFSMLSRPRWYRPWGRPPMGGFGMGRRF